MKNPTASPARYSAKLKIIKLLDLASYFEDKFDVRQRMQDMTWLHIHDLIWAQLRFFPLGDIRPFAPLPAEWPAIEAMFRQEEESSRPVINAAIDRFIHKGSWPDELNNKERVWISGRIQFASEFIVRLSVPLTEDWDLLPVPRISDEQLIIWLLILQWETLGFSEWLRDLENLFRDRHQDQKEPFDSSRLPSFGHRDVRQPWPPN